MNFERDLQRRLMSEIELNMQRHMRHNHLNTKKPAMFNESKSNFKCLPANLNLLLPQGSNQRLQMSSSSRSRQRDFSNAMKNIIVQRVESRQQLQPPIEL